VRSNPFTSRNAESQPSWTAGSDSAVRGSVSPTTTSGNEIRMVSTYPAIARAVSSADQWQAWSPSYTVAK
jgi:hypothetical protein